MFWINHIIGAVGGDNAARPTAAMNALMIRQIIQRILCGGQNLNIKAIKQRPRQKRRISQLLRNCIIKRIGIFSRWAFGQVEQFFECIF